MSTLRVVYHEAFWVTSGTVAPVVALAHVVLIGKFDNKVGDLADTRGRIVDDLATRGQQVLDRAAPLEARTSSLERRSRELSSRFNDLDKPAALDSVANLVGELERDVTEVKAVLDVSHDLSTDRARSRDIETDT
jgi:hypothetical protein